MNWPFKKKKVESNIDISTNNMPQAEIQISHVDNQDQIDDLKNKIKNLNEKMESVISINNDLVKTNEIIHKSNPPINERIFCYNHEPPKKLEEWDNNEGHVKGCKQCEWYERTP